MPTVFIPPLLRDLTGKQDRVVVPGKTVGEVLDELDKRFPGIKKQLCDDEGLKPAVAVTVDSYLARLGLREPVSETSEVHFLPAIAGG